MQELYCQFNGLLPEFPFVSQNASYNNILVFPVLPGGLSESTLYCVSQFFPVFHSGNVSFYHSTGYSIKINPLEKVIDYEFEGFYSIAFALSVLSPHNSPCLCGLVHPVYRGLDVPNVPIVLFFTNSKQNLIWVCFSLLEIFLHSLYAVWETACYIKPLGELIIVECIVVIAPQIFSLQFSDVSVLPY